MKASYTHISYKRLRTLLAVVDNAKEKSIDRIGTLYRQKEQEYKSTLDFATGLKILNVCNNRINIVKAIKTTLKGSLLSDESLKPLLVSKVLSHQNYFKKETERYLDNFIFDKSTYVYKPQGNERTKYRGIRNFLVELGLIKYDGINKVYSIAQKHLSEFTERKTDIPLSSNELKAIIKKKDELGKDAEIAVIGYERKRLAGHPALVEKIEHIGQKNVKAGYDIISWEVPTYGREKPIKRYIEVKAIGLYETRFFWSKNEVKKAQKYGPQYSLYLVPVASDKRFDMERLEIIPNPHKEIFNNKEWNEEVETFLFKKIK